MQEWILVPVPKGQKAPRRKDWPEIRDWVPDGTSNVGLHLGPSMVVDVDLDVPEAVELAPKFLTPTRIFGRDGKPQGHWLYSGSATYHKFIDPVDRQCLVEIRAGDGKQSVIPPGTWTDKESGSTETISWYNEDELAPFPGYEAVAQLAAMAWCKRHPGEEIHPKVLAWLEGEPAARPAQTYAASNVHFDAVDEALIESIVTACPEKSRHDYRLAVAGAMKRGGVAESAASDMLAVAMADLRLGDDRGDAERDARAAVRDTYSTTRPFTGAGRLIELGGRTIVERIEALTAPKIGEIPWLERLKEEARGSNYNVLEDSAIVNGLARLSLSKDSRLPRIYAELKDAQFRHLKELKETVDLRAQEIRRRSVDPNAPLATVAHAEAAGMTLPPGYSVEDGILKFGEETIMHGELILLAKCPSSEGVQARFAWRSPINRNWRHSIAPFRSLVDARGVLCLAEHGVNVSSLESASIVGFVRDFVATNEKLLDRPVATQTGWHASGAFVWGRHIIDGPEDLSAEYAADNQIAVNYADALTRNGDQAMAFEALREAVETQSTAALCIAASLAACWVHRARRPTIGIHLAGMGGKGKTRTLKIAGSVWGSTGGAAQFAAGGTIAGANATQRALEVAASVRNDLPLLLSDVRPVQGLPETLHAILNGDPRARATQKGGATQGASYRAGALITEGELNVLTLTTRQGFHRRMLEVEPDDRAVLWRLGSLCSEHYGHLGPAFLLGRDWEALADRATLAQAELSAVFGHDVAAAAGTLVATAEAAAEILGASAETWTIRILESIQADRGARSELTQIDRAKEDLQEILVDLGPQIADTQEQTLQPSNKPWLGYRTPGAVVVRAQALRDALVARGHDAIRDAVKGLDLPEAKQMRVCGVRVRCYVVPLE